MALLSTRGFQMPVSPTFSFISLRADTFLDSGSATIYTQLLLMNENIAGRGSREKNSNDMLPQNRMF